MPDSAQGQGLVLASLMRMKQERNDEASAFMKEHLQYTMSSIAKIGDILQP